MLFTDFFAGTIQMYQYGYFIRYTGYNGIANKIKGMPPKWLFSIIWIIIYIFLLISLFVYYRNVVFPDNTGYAIDTITIIITSNILSSKIWSYYFFYNKNTIMSILLILLVIISSIIIIIIFGINSNWVSFGTFIPYILWSIYLLYINSSWIYYQREYGIKMKKKIIKK